MGEALTLWRRLVGARVRAQLEYRTSLALDSFGSLAIGFTDFLAVLVLFHQVPALSGWDLADVTFLYAVSELSFVFTDMIVGHLDQLAVQIRDGSFDLLLVRPIGSLLQVVASDFALRRVGRLLGGAALLAYSFSRVDVDWTVGRLATLPVMVASGSVIFGSLWVIGSTSTFWLIDGMEITNAFTYGGNAMSRYPLDIFGPWLRRLGMLLGLAFVSYFPALYVLGRPGPRGLPGLLRFASPIVAAAMAVVAGTVWRFAVRHYRSTGS